jgi:heme-degrading monooxygenase HmoA
MGTMRWDMRERTNGWRRSPPEGGNHVGGDAIAEPEHAIEELGEQIHRELRSVPE